MVMLRISHDELQPSEDFMLLTYGGKPFTGVGFERDSNGTLLCEIEYVDGQRHGSTRDWFSSGRLKKEEQYKLGARHGVDREWDESGVLRSESEFELGVCLCRRRWDKSGALVENMKLDENSAQFATLKKLRTSTIGRLLKTYGWRTLRLQSTLVFSRRASCQCHPRQHVAQRLSAGSGGREQDVLHHLLRFPGIGLAREQALREAAGERAGIQPQGAFDHVRRFIQAILHY